MAIDWSRGYAASWRLFRVDPRTWADAEALPRVVSATVDRDGTGDAPLLEAGTIVLDREVGESLPECYMRLCMIAEQGGERERVDVATLLCATVSGEASRGVDATEVTGRSVLWPASVRHLARGSYAPAGCDGAAFVGQMLSSALRAPVRVSGTFTLDTHVVFDLGSSVLKAAWLVLGAGGFVLRVSGRGEVTVCPMPDEPDLVLDRVGASLLMPSVSHELDLSGVPNRYVAIDGEREAEAVNDDPTSPTSVAARGYVSDLEDDSPIPVNGETLQAYCERRLEESSVAKDTRTYRREWWPGVTPFSVVRGSVASVGVEGDLRVESQSLGCGAGIVVTERACREVRTWQRP